MNIGNEMKQYQIESSANENIDTLVNSFVSEVGNKCSICNRSYSTMFDLRAHIKTVHLELNSFRCEICNFNCYFKKTMMKHATTHSKQSFLDTNKDLSSNNVLDKFELFKINMSQCHICKQILSGKYAAKTHIRAVHLKIKPHKCATCNYKSYNRSDLAKHIKVHDKNKNSDEITESSFVSKVSNIFLPNWVINFDLLYRRIKTGV